MTMQAAFSAQMQAGTPHDLGAVFDGEGTNFAVFSDNGDQVWLCLFSDDGTLETQRIALPERTGGIWHGYLPGVRPGTLYGYRVAGPYAPERGHRFNAHKLLLDPYARQFQGGFSNHSATFGYMAGSHDKDLSFDARDSAPYIPKCIVPDPATFPLDARPLRRGWDDTLIYEAHVKGATILHPDVPGAQRGTYDGLGSPAMLDHLTALGVTAIEILPVQAIRSEGALEGRGLVNYWGYNTIGFFAPEPRYLGPSGVRGFRAMVDRFHAAGIEVILDVVYNHSAEGDHMGPTLSFRGLDNASYYRLLDGQPRYYVNDTGTGNTLDAAHPFVLRMIMDSLRFWVQAMGVDGFRFDLGATLARGQHGFDPMGGFLHVLRQDPVLNGLKLIAEPWDIGPGGYQLGNFPPKFAEWNDRARDTMRRFWRGDERSAQDLGSVLLGSAEIFDTRGRRVWSSINYVAAHDGFTLADLSRYTKRHNEANGEKNRDGHHSNYSVNFGVEGDTDDPDTLAARAQRQRNLLATVMLSQGTPMILCGDEGGNSQCGNNNAYAQDNAISWVDWTRMDPDMIAFTAALARFRRDHPVLRQPDYLHGTTRPDGLPDVEWRAFDGGPVNWRDPGLSHLCLLLRGNAERARGKETRDCVALAFNRDPHDSVLQLPSAGDRIWVRGIDTARTTQTRRALDGLVATVAAQSICAFYLGYEDPA